MFRIPSGASQTPGWVHGEGGRALTDGGGSMASQTHVWLLTVVTTCCVVRALFENPARRVRPFPRKVSGDSQQTTRPILADLSLALGNSGPGFN